MLKALGRTGDGRPLLVLGLSGENMTRLMAAEPIHIDLGKMGLPPIQVLVVGGRTEDAIRVQLRSHGLGPACCDRHSQHCVRPAELCCAECTEAAHPEHPPGVRCVLDTEQPRRV